MHPLKSTLLLSALLVGPAAAQEQAKPLHDFLSVALSPDGKRVATIEGDETPFGAVVAKHVVIRDVEDGAVAAVPLPCGEVLECAPSSLAWSPDSQHLSFTLRKPGSHEHSIYTARAVGGPPVKTADFHGTLDDLRYTPDGDMVVLAIAEATKEVGATQAGAPVAGVLGGEVHEQRIARVGSNGALNFVSPPDMFVYEYDILPGNSGFIGTAAHGDGDNNWWIAKLYRFDPHGQPQVIYTPDSPRQQLADPHVSPDGKQVAFIGGIMSDFGSTGGDAFLVSVDGGENAKAQDITPGLRASVTSLAWACDGKSLLASELASDQNRLVTLPLDASGRFTVLYSSWERLSSGGGGPLSAPCGTQRTATVHSTFTTAPEVEVGPIGHWHDMTHVNGTQQAAALVKNIVWGNDNFKIQGWLVLPSGAYTDQQKKLPMVTLVHGGPAASQGPYFLGGRLVRALMDHGYALFMPNPRGSFGQGEAFTQANVKDLGHGDLRDILAGIDAAAQQAPIDTQRLAIMGGSYGGFMTMWAVTQTNQFKAGIALAGISDWLSYYGENGIDGWLLPYFGASVYDDPAVYAKSSPINYIKAVKTPTLEVVGENDIECPAPQTQEFWHALDALGVPTEGVIYAGEGHGLREPKHQEDFEGRMIKWLDKYLKT